MIIGIGIDIVEIDRIEHAAIQRQRFLERIFTPAELKYCLSKSQPYQCLAARFAAKEAVFKAVGRLLSWCEVEIVNKQDIGLKAHFYGRAKQIVGSDKEVLITISHSQRYAVAYAMMLKK